MGADSQRQGSGRGYVAGSLGLFCKWRWRWRARAEVAVEDVFFAADLDFGFVKDGVGFIDQAFVDCAPVAEAGTVSGWFAVEVFEAELALSLECAEFGERAVEESIELRAGAVDGLLGGGIGGGFGFDFAAAAEAPEGAADFGGEGFLDRAGRAEFGADGFIEGGPDGLFVGEDEVARGEEAGFGGVLGGGRFALFGAGAG